MRVIGTAGHVDHGKTALILALTNMDPDRLPEEKARGMTTDLGFAWYQGPDGQDVGVVDVPGHERYLRNMAAGAWGLDMALLVVAADDGWMPQSQVHASILACMGVSRVLIVVSKTDLAQRERTDSVIADVTERAAKILGYRPHAVSVSVKAGTGLSELKQAIACELASLPPLPEDSAYCYVDRHFTPRGGGSVVTGTLRGGPLAEGERLVLLPEGDQAKIKAIQTHRRGQELVRPAARVALSLSSRKDGYRRGQLLVKDGVRTISGTDLLAVLQPLPGTDTLCPLDKRGRALIRPGVEAELALGSAHGEVVLWPLKDSRLVRVACAQALACPAGQPFILIRKGGSDLIGRGLVIGTAPPGQAGRKSLSASAGQAEALVAALASSAPALAPSQAWDFALELTGRGHAFLPADLPPTAVAGLNLLAAGRVAFTQSAWNALSATLAHLASKPEGLGRAAAQSACSLRDTAADAVLSTLVAQGALTRSGAIWRIPGQAPTLSPALAELLKRLGKAGAAGLEPGASAPKTDAPALKQLCSLGLAVPLDGGIFLASREYARLSAAILAGMSPGQLFGVGLAKERTGLSRKYILPLLNRMEDRGLLKRRGDEREVLRLPHANGD
ncbi:MAG: SelB C-terminal domain-containing protein [Spirochaetia bacterium]|nr:SelB C-terminal domain-containing protein [Spirochaetia bacterium]